MATKPPQVSPGYVGLLYPDGPQSAEEPGATTAARRRADVGESWGVLQNALGRSLPTSLRNARALAGMMRKAVK